MKQTLNLQSNYSAIENGYQLWIPLDCSISIPEDDPVRLLNRSIQAEGTFAFAKEDMDFRRFLTRGKKKVEAEWLLLSLAINILKLHFKIQKGRLGTALKVPESFPKGL
ncbi:MAG: transposase [Clostridia bacterium]|nr:transposase [Clostridia bacterium]